MAPSDTVPGYSRRQRRLHALVIALVAFQYLTRTAVRDAMTRLDGAQTVALFDFLVTTAHSLVGLAIGALMYWRWQLRRERRVPVARATLPPGMAVWVVRHHRLLYALAALLVVSGSLHYYAEVPYSRWVHEYAGRALLLALFVHAGGAAWHALWRRDGVVSGMFGQR